MFFNILWYWLELDVRKPFSEHLGDVLLIPLEIQE